MTDDGKVRKLDCMVPGCWIHLSDPEAAELDLVSKQTTIDMDMLKAALDEEERSRIDVEDTNTLIVVDTPVIESDGNSFSYSTLPFGIILTDDYIVTVCSTDTPLARSFAEGAVKNFSTKKFNRMTLQLLYRNALLFLFYLRQVDKQSNRIEAQLHKTMKNKDLILMMGLEKSLVFFSTSLKGNEAVHERLLRMSFVSNFPDDTDLLEDVMVENKQAIEMCNIYRDIMTSSMDAFASIISNNLNMVMKVLTSITIIISIPTLFSSIWGMNFNLPFQNSPAGFFIVMGIAVVSTIAAILVMFKKDWL